MFWLNFFIFFLISIAAQVIEQQHISSILKLKAAIQSPQDLEKLMIKADQDPNIRVVIIYVENKNDIKLITNSIDSFIAPRLHWFLKSEPHTWQTHLSPIILMKSSSRIEPFLRLKSENQFPPSQSECEKKPLFIINSLDAWGSKNGEYSSQYGRFQYAVVGTFFSQFGNPTASNAMFVDAATCPDLVDKFLCAFLPTTNCSYPTTLCPKEGGQCAGADEGGDALFLSASPKGVRVSKKNSTFWAAQIPENGFLPLPGKNPIEVPNNIQGIKYTELGPNTSHSYYSMNPQSNLFNFNLMYRPNGRFRELIQHSIHQFRTQQTPPFLPTTQCVALHIRRGDRAIDSLTGKDALDFCDYCTKNGKEGYFTIPSKGINETCDSSKVYQRPSLGDMGCDKNERGFSAVTLDQFLEFAEIAASSIPTQNPNKPVRTALIITDSGSWVHDQIRLLHPSIRSRWDLPVFSSAPGQTHRDYTTPNGVNFLATLSLASQCEAFVGHWCSAAAQYILHSMCAHHATATSSIHIHASLMQEENASEEPSAFEGKFWTCPPFFDVCRG